MATPRLREIFRSDTIRITAAASGSERWDQVAKFGAFKKGGKPSAFNLETLSQFIKNFTRQANPLPGDVEHQAIYAPDNGQPAPLAAKYDALALIENGKVVGYHSQTGESFDAAGQQLADGLWAHRVELTPFGRDLLENKGYGFISPTFTTEGLNEQGEEVGYELLTVSWTVIPFLDGMAPVRLSRLSFGQAPPTALPKENCRMDKKALYARYGLAEDATEDQLHAAMARFADAADEKEKQAMADAKDDAETDEEKKKADDDLAAMRKLAGLGDKATLKEIHLAMSATRVEPSEIAQMRTKIAELEAVEKKRGEDSIRDRAEQLATFAVSSGRMADEKPRRDNIVELAMANYDSTKKFVDGLAVTFPTKESVTQTFRTSVDQRTGRRDATPSDVEVAGVEFNRLVDERVAKTKEPVAVAMRAVAKERPELWSAAK